MTECIMNRSRWIERCSHLPSIQNVRATFCVWQDSEYFPGISLLSSEIFQQMSKHGKVIACFFITWTIYKHMQKIITSSAGMLCHEAMVILWKLKFITMRSWIKNRKESWNQNYVVLKTLAVSWIKRKRYLEGSIVMIKKSNDC